MNLSVRCIAFHRSLLNKNVLHRWSNELKQRQSQRILNVTSTTRCLSSKRILENRGRVPLVVTGCASADKLFTTPLLQSQHIRSYHSSNNQKKTNSAIDTRMAGRRRFYKTVDITPLPAPWTHVDQHSDAAKDVGSNSTPQQQHLDNPISPGVDGTNSASGVSLERPTQNTLRSALTPSKNDHTDDASTEWFGVTLDGTPLRTPLGTSLAVPSLPLALALATEWDEQKTIIQPAQMPLMTLVCTTLDQNTSPAVRADVIEQLMSYLRNDTTCYWADPTEDRILNGRQSRHWEDLHRWVEKDVGVLPATAIGAGEGLLISRKREGGKSFVGLPHGDKLMVDARNFLEGCDAWTLTGMQSVTREAKSFLVGMAVMRGAIEGKGRGVPFDDDTSKAVMASRVEEEFQIENWGLVEGQHDYDRLNCSINIHAATILVSCILNNVK